MKSFLQRMILNRTTQLLNNWLMLDSKYTKNQFFDTWWREMEQLYTSNILSTMMPSTKTMLDFADNFKIGRKAKVRAVNFVQTHNLSQNIVSIACKNYFRKNKSPEDGSELLLNLFPSLI